MVAPSFHKNHQKTVVSMNRNLAATLKAHRKAAGLSIRELSRRANIGPTSICSLEKGTRNPTIDTLDALFGAMGQRLSLRVENGVDDIPEAPPLNLASRIQAGLDSASPELLAAMAHGIELAAKAHPTDAGQYWLSIAAEMRSISYERRTGA
jgi:XRE family transcriptional regulator, regulator of sulfur utilization